MLKSMREMKMSTSFLVALLGVLVLAVLNEAQDQSGFISIACGGPADSEFTEIKTGIKYTSDAHLISSGVSRSITSELKSSYQRQVWNLRSFPEGIRNCYTINITRGSKYLIRANFLYGNYDGLNKLPKFDLLLGANWWATVNIQVASDYQFNEIIHIPSLDYIQICLANTGAGTPFISSIELRTLKNITYVTQIGSLEHYLRWDLGSTSGDTYRYSDDVYDRFWNPYGYNKDWTQLSVSIEADSLIQNIYNPPEIVLSTAATPVDASAPMEISWEPENEGDQFYVYMHFKEVQVLKSNQTREFNIIRKNGEAWYENFAPVFNRTNTIFSRVASKEFTYSLERTENSTLPPIINAIEIYRLKEFQQPETFQGDVDAITTIKSVYEVKRNWEGDPCNPLAYMWEGLNCSNDGYNSPRITTLSLSSSGLTGTIDVSISQLTMLEKLDLSNNSLSGKIPDFLSGLRELEILDLSNNSLNDKIPDFLSELRHLKILNLENNNLTRPIPPELVVKSKDGSLLLRVDPNLYPCESGQCKDNKKNILIPIVASVGGLLILLAAVAAIFWKLKKRKSKVTAPSEISLQYREQTDTSLQVRNKQTYSYSDVLNITNNFNTILGKGGFGTVYLGYIDDTPVAVKMLSPSSVQGYQQFQAEVKLLMRVHHRNLTTLVGYCNEKTHKGLIYEYMVNGDLLQHLSGKGSNPKFLTWEDRLHIAVDAALGLEYLQNGCKPPIIHRDIKSTNILLNEIFQAKLSDFGLSKIIPTEGGSHISTVVAGTLGYMDPDYYTTNRLTEKSDVYSFGVVLLELITSQPVIARNHEKTHIVQWVNSLVATGDIKAIACSKLGGEYDVNSMWRAVEIAMVCVSPNPTKRPIMSVVVTELKECLATELARTKSTRTNTGESGELLTVNLYTSVSPMAR